MPPQTSLTAFQDALRESRRIIAVCGAGLSAASGIPTFRGAGGLWRTFDAMKLATPEAFAKDPSLVWQFYHYRRETAFKSVPNAAHEALAWLSIPQNRLTVAPNSVSFDIITQNVDGLSLKAARASSDPDSALRNILEMHGAVADTKCTQCHHRETNLNSPICPALGGTEDNLLKPDENDTKISVDELPRCTQPGCNGLLRPAVVWFGERIPLLRTIDGLVDKADLCIVVGTSSTVYPAAGFASVVKQQGGRTAVFNLDRSEGDRKADFLFLGPCEDLLPAALGIQTSE